VNEEEDEEEYLKEVDHYSNAVVEEEPFVLYEETSNKMVWFVITL
jgi:hypothetical protein